MDVPAALLRDLLALSVSVDGDDVHDPGPELTALVTALRTAVPSYRGLDLTLHDHGQPVILSSFLPGAEGKIATSLRLSLAGLSAGFDSRSQVIFYATTPGAFVDLAADLGYALGAPAVLDADLAPQTLVSQLTGLEDLATINRAVGMLIEQGEDPAEAHATLRRSAAAAGVDTHVYAARLLRR